MQDHPAEQKMHVFGHSDSYTGVLQSTLVFQPLTTSGQLKVPSLEFRPILTNI